MCRVFNPKAEVILAKTAVIEDFEDAERVLRSMLDLMEEVVEESGVRSSLQAIGVITPVPSTSRKVRSPTSMAMSTGGTFPSAR